MLIQYHRESQQAMSVITIRTPQVDRNYLWKQTHRWRETDRENRIESIKSQSHEVHMNQQRTLARYLDWKMGQ